MSPLQTYRERPVAVLTNDDGPPGDSSPNIYEFAKGLQSTLGWDVRVVIPDCQKSWVGKAYAISEIIKLSYFYPLGGLGGQCQVIARYTLTAAPDGRKGDISPVSRPLKEGETMEWVLLSGTPATCANIALHNLYPGEVDILISGPNHGRNSSSAFAMSSGTIGAALAGALSVPVAGPKDKPSLHVDHMPAIAVSFGVVERPVPKRVNELAQEAAVEVVARLFNDWGYEDRERTKKVQVYSVNVPLVERDLVKENRKVCWTSLWRNTYGRLFKATEMTSSKWDPSDKISQTESKPNDPQNVPPQDVAGSAGPNAVATPPQAATPPLAPATQQRFQFAPDLQPILFPAADDVPYGTDAWAFARGYITVTPITTDYAGLADGGCGFASETDVGPHAGREWSRL